MHIYAHIEVRATAFIDADACMHTHVRTHTYAVLHTSIQLSPLYSVGSDNVSEELRVGCFLSDDISLGLSECLYNMSNLNAYCISGDVCGLVARVYAHKCEWVRVSLWLCACVGLWV